MKKSFLGTPSLSNTLFEHHTLGPKSGVWGELVGPTPFFLEGKCLLIRGVRWLDLVQLFWCLWTFILFCSDHPPNGSGDERERQLPAEALGPLKTTDLPTDGAALLVEEAAKQPDLDPKIADATEAVCECEDSPEFVSEKQNLTHKVNRAGKFTLSLALQGCETFLLFLKSPSKTTCGFCFVTFVFILMVAMLTSSQMPCIQGQRYRRTSPSGTIMCGPSSPFKKHPTSFLALEPAGKLHGWNIVSSCARNSAQPCLLLSVWTVATRLHVWFEVFGTHACLWPSGGFTRKATDHSWHFHTCFFPLIFLESKERVVWSLHQFETKTSPCPKSHLDLV